MFPPWIQEGFWHFQSRSIVPLPAITSERRHKVLKPPPPGPSAVIQSPWKKSTLLREFLFCCSSRQPASHCQPHMGAILQVQPTEPSDNYSLLCNHTGLPWEMPNKTCSNRWDPQRRNKTAAILHHWLIWSPSSWCSNFTAMAHSWLWDPQGQKPLLYTHPLYLGLPR